MTINMCDVMLHIDEELGDMQRDLLENHVREQRGVIGLGFHKERPHLMIVEFNPDQTTSQDLLATVTSQGLHAELIGL